MRSRSRLFVFAGIAATFALAGSSSWIRAARARSVLSTGAAEWVWSGDAQRERGPSAFWAARDFTLDSVPKSAVIQVQADPEYVLYLNGQRIGAGSFRVGAPLDGYEVAPLLEPGTNRLQAELRSDHGAGGFLLSLADGTTGRQLLASDRSWTILRRDDANLLRGLRPLDGGTPAYSWSYPPIGRWGTPRLGAVRPYRFAPPTPWIPVARSGEPGREVGFTWKDRVTGRLALRVTPKEATQIAVLRILEDGGDGTDAAAISVLLMPNQSEWLDSEVRHIRAVEVAGTLAIEQARVIPPDGPEDRVAEPQGPPRGLFGLTPPPLRTPVQDEVGRELERLPHL